MVMVKNFMTMTPGIYRSNGQKIVVGLPPPPLNNRNRIKSDLLRFTTATVRYLYEFNQKFQFAKVAVDYGDPEKVKTIIKLFESRLVLSIRS